MADNVTSNSGDAGGPTFATDEIVGATTVHWPFVKLAFGPLDTATVVNSTTTDPLPVALSDTDNAVLDTIDVDTGNIATNTTDLPNVIGTDGSAGPTKALSVGGTDGSGNLQELLTDTDGHLQVDVLTGGGGGTQYTEADVDATIVGTAAMMEVAGDTLQPVQGTVADGLLVNLGTNNDVTFSGPVSLSSSYTVLIKSGTITAVTDITNPVTVTGAVAISLSHSVVVSNTVTVDGSGVTQPVSGTVTVTGGVAISLSTSVVISGPLPAGTNHLGSVSVSGGTIVLGAGTANVGTVSLSGSTTAVVVGRAAHGATVAGSPVLTGWEARTSMPTAVTNGQAVRGMADKNGRVVNTPIAPRGLVGMLVHSATVSDTTTWLAAGGAGVFRDIIGFTMTNPSTVSEATVTLYTSLTLGTEVMKFHLAPNAGLVYTPSTPIPASVANNAWGIRSTVVGLLSSIHYTNNN